MRGVKRILRKFIILAEPLIIILTLFVFHSKRRRICHGVGFFKSSPRQDDQVVHQTKSSSTLSVSLVKRLLFLDAEDRPVSHFSKLQEFPDSPQSPQDESQTVPVVEHSPQDESHTVAVVEPSSQEQKGKDVEVTLTSVENPEVGLFFSSDCSFFSFFFFWEGGGGGGGCL